MDFTAKNFRYVTAEFGHFTQRIEQGDRVYLRALSHDKPSEQPALLADDFPALAPDFVLPAQLSLVAENLFSSVLRMSGPVNMWLHYDVSEPRPPLLLFHRRPPPSLYFLLLLFIPSFSHHLSLPLLPFPSLQCLIRVII